MTLRKWRFPNIPFIRDVGYPSPRYRHFERSREIFLALCSFLFPSQKNSRFLLSHIRRYTSVRERSLGFARDDDTGIALSKHIRCTLREINPSPLPSFRAQREIFLALCSFLLLSRKVSPFPLSHIGRYTGVPERSLGFARDDDTGIALSKHIRCTLREINPSPLPSFRAQREIFLALCSFLLPSQKVSPFPLSHIRRYTGVQERSLDFARDDDTGIALSKHIRCTMRGISPYDAKEKSPSQSWSFFVSERLICQTVRAWCLLLLQYQ